MNPLYLGYRLGAVTSPTFQRHQNDRLIHSLRHGSAVSFSYVKSNPEVGEKDARASNDVDEPLNVAHQGGVNCLAIDRIDGRFLVSGGADSSLRLWDLESIHNQDDRGTPLAPCANSSRADKQAHTHALTSVSIYPFDPIPSTILTTAHDKTFKLTSITPTSLIPVHTFDLGFAPYTHSISEAQDSSPLVAVGTAHPAIRLLDLRSGLSTHSLPGHNGAVQSVTWSPKSSFILASGAFDGRVLFFDVRRANAAFASLDLDDAIGVEGADVSTGSGARKQLDWNTHAHNGPITSVQWTPSADKIVTAGHDQRIRVWDAATGKNDLVHFGPRIRNDRLGELKPLISPVGIGKVGHEVLLWPNDDGKGDIFMHDLREGNMLKILRPEGIKRNQFGNAGRLTSGGRINQMAWRLNATIGSGLEMYSAHGDGQIRAWIPFPEDEEEDDSEGQLDETSLKLTAEEESENKKKRKRDLIGDLVEGLTKRPITFS